MIGEFPYATNEGNHVVYRNTSSNQFSVRRLATFVDLHSFASF